jgi:nitrite reductase/ring-hydroxylating ferredoxin subunit
VTQHGDEDPLCRAAEVIEATALRLDVDGTSVLAIRRNGRIHCYRNRCPHRGTELDWLPGRFLDDSGTMLQCSTHGALFDIASGECLAGPCVGERLDAVQLKEHDGYVFTVRSPG